jgi:hypothetical protein
MKKHFYQSLACILLLSCFNTKLLAQPGNTLAFDGTDDNITVPAHAAFQISSAITLETWVYATKSSGIQNVMCNSSSTQNRGYIFPRTDDGWVSAALYLYISGNWRIVNVAYPSRNAWHHLAATYDDATDSMKVYVNGNLVNWQVISGAGPVDINTNNLTLGMHTGYGEYFGGSVDEARIWNVARTQAQIQAGMYNTVSPSSTGLVAYYNFDQGSAGSSNTSVISLPDVTGNSHTGTLANFSLNGAASNWLESYAMVVPVTLPATSIDTTAFTANWTAPSVGTATNYLLDVSINSNFSSFVSGYNALNVGTATSYAVTGLTRDVNYYYRVKANKSSASGQGAYSSAIGVELLYRIPVITSFTPASATVSGQVVITGTDLYRTSTVTFGDSVAPFTVNSSTQITAIIHSGATGTVRVTTPAGMASSPGFTFIPPAPLVINSFTPQVGKSGATITISGTGFGAASVVSFGGQPAALFTVVSSTTITAVVSSAASSGSVLVTTPFGTATKTGFETVHSISYFSPIKGPIGTSITITGTNFSSTPGDNIVNVGGIRATVTNASSTSLTVTVPAGTTNVPLTVSVNQRTVSFSVPFVTTFNGPAPTIYREIEITANSFGPQINFAMSGPTSPGIKMADLDGDGKSDFINASGQIFRNTSTTDSVSFAPAIYFTTGEVHQKLKVADLNGDGKSDLIGYGIWNNIYLYRNTSTIGTLSFVGTSMGFPSDMLDIGEVDGDGRPDMATLWDDLNLWRNTSTSSQLSFSFQLTVTSITLAPSPVFVLHDFNWDGKADLVVVSDDIYSVVNTSSGIGNFSFDFDYYQVAGPDYLGPNFYPGSTSGIDVIDVDGGGIPDIVVNCGGSLSAYTCGGMRFSWLPNIFTDCLSPNVEVVDFNGEGRLDLCFVSSAGQVATCDNFRYSSDGVNFHPSKTYSLGGGPQNVVTGDVNGDGKPDLVTANSSPFSFSVLLNQMPVIESSTPRLARMGDTITITGNGFSGATAVTLNGDVLAAAWFTVVSPTCIKAVVGNVSSFNNSIGTWGEVSVTTPAGKSRLSDGFAWKAMQYTSITPKILGLGMTATIAGSNFTNINSVKFQYDGPDASFTVSPHNDTIKAVLSSIINRSVYNMEIRTTAASEYLAPYFGVLFPPGNALTFNGTNNLLSVRYTSTLNPAVFSVECWAKTESSVGTLRTVVSSSNAMDGYRIFVNDSNEWCVSIGHTSTGWTIVNSGKKVSGNRWTHIAATYDGAILQLYINGIAAGSASGSFAANTTAPLQFGAGTNETTPSLFFNGSIDEARIWNTVRTAAEIKTGMRNMVAPAAPGLVGYYTFDVAPPGTLLFGYPTDPYYICQDITTNKNDGTILNFSLADSTSNWVESYAMVLPQALAATNISSTKFKANFTGPLTGSADSYMIDISTDSNFTSFVNGYNGAITFTGTFTATGLTPNTTYYYRVRANKSTVDGTGCYTATVKVITYPTPTITSFSPASAILGTSVTIKGTHFIAPVTVRFGGTAAASVSVINDTTIVAVVGAGTSGNVSVAMHEDTVILAGFTYLTATTWTGAVSAVWNDAGNWNNGIPDTTQIAIVPTVARQPDINGTQTVRDMTLNTSTPFVVSGNMQVTGTLINNGIISGAGNIALSGTAAQTISGTGTIRNLTLNNTNGATITNGVENTQSISGTLTLTNGTFTTNGNLILTSNATGTANVAAMDTIIGNITGTIMVERYIPSVARRWRFMSSPVSNATLEDWRNEIFITGPGTGTTAGTLNSNGFDATLSNAPSVYSYDETLTGNLNGGWVTPASSAVPLTVGKGYRVFIRGDRADIGRLTGTKASQNEVTLNVAGELNKGNITMPVTYTATGGDANDDGWNLLGNPYASPYDWNAFWNTGNSDNNGTNYANISPVIYIFDATSNSYCAYNALAHSGTFNGIIASGQCFFARTTAENPFMTFKEQFKVADLPTQLFKTGVTDELWIRMERDSITFDDFILKNVSTATALHDNYDIYKMWNTECGFGSYGTDAVYHALDSRPITGLSDTINLFTSGLNGTFQFQFRNLPELPAGKQFYLEDAYLKIAVPITLGLQYSFTIQSAIPQTTGANRFRLVTDTVSFPMPVSIENVNRQQKLFTVYPNPFSSSCTISVNLERDEKVLIEIVDLCGKIVASQTSILSRGTNKIALKNPDKLQAGIYFAKARFNEMTQIIKLVKE